jgi:hypothetical protein
MARINTISDGQPFTYQLLNGMIEAINNITVPDGGDSDELINIVGPDVNNAKNKPQIVFGKDQIDIPDNQTGQNKSIKFPGGGNFNNDPIILATLVDPETDGAIPIGYLTITSVSKSEFKCRVKLIRKRSKGTTVEVNYVAIGTTSK